jgi:hypothetical protein
MGANFWTGSKTAICWRNIISRRVRYPIYILWLQFIGVHKNQTIWLIYLLLKLQFELSNRRVKTSKELQPVPGPNAIPLLRFKRLRKLLISQSEPPVRPPERNSRDNRQCLSQCTLTFASEAEVPLPHPNHNDSWVTISYHSNLQIAIHRSTATLEPILWTIATSKLHNF